MVHNKVILIFLCLAGSSMSFPVDQRNVGKINPESVSEKKGEANIIKSPKQDDNDGDTDGFGLDGIGSNLSKIVSGAVTGNLGSIFGGSTAFIGEGDTQKAVSGLLDQVYKPLNKVVQSSLTQISGGTVGTTQKSAATTTKKRVESDDDDDDDDDSAAVARS